MSARMMLKGGLALLPAMALVPSAATAQDNRAQARVDAVVSCINIADNAARLACFDRAAAGLREGLDAGTVAVDDGEGFGRRRPVEVESVEANVASAAQVGMWGWRLDLDNGQVWQSEGDVRGPRLPEAGTAIRVRRGPGGGYWLRLPSGREFRFRRLQ